MLKDITIGQFFPGNSLLHRLDPRMKIILTVLYIVLLFVARNIASFLAVMLFSFILIAISRISPKLIFKSFKTTSMRLTNLSIQIRPMLNFLML